MGVVCVLGNKALLAIVNVLGNGGVDVVAVVTIGDDTAIKKSFTIERIHVLNSSIKPIFDIGTQEWCN
jgi:hypothetical protein